MGGAAALVRSMRSLRAFTTSRTEEEAFVTASAVYGLIKRSATIRARTSAVNRDGNKRKAIDDGAVAPTAQVRLVGVAMKAGVTPLGFGGGAANVRPSGSWATAHLRPWCAAGASAGEAGASGALHGAPTSRFRARAAGTDASPLTAREPGGEGGRRGGYHVKDTIARGGPPGFAGAAKVAAHDGAGFRSARSSGSGAKADGGAAFRARLAPFSGALARPARGTAGSATGKGGGLLRVAFERPAHRDDAVLRGVYGPAIVFGWIT